MFALCRLCRLLLVVFSGFADLACVFHEQLLRQSYVVYMVAEAGHVFRKRIHLHHDLVQRCDRNCVNDAVSNLLLPQTLCQDTDAACGHENSMPLVDLLSDGGCHVKCLNVGAGMAVQVHLRSWPALWTLVVLTLVSRIAGFLAILGLLAVLLGILTLLTARTALRAILGLLAGLLAVLGTLTLVAALLTASLASLASLSATAGLCALLAVDVGVTAGIEADLVLVNIYLQASVHVNVLVKEVSKVRVIEYTHRDGFAAVVHVNFLDRIRTFAVAAVLDAAAFYHTSRYCSRIVALVHVEDFNDRRELILTHSFGIWFPNRD